MHIYFQSFFSSWLLNSYRHEKLQGARPPHVVNLASWSSDGWREPHQRTLRRPGGNLPDWPGRWVQLELILQANKQTVWLRSTLQSLVFPLIVQNPSGRRPTQKPALPKCAQPCDQSWGHLSLQADSRTPSIKFCTDLFILSHCEVKGICWSWGENSDCKSVNMYCNIKFFLVFFLVCFCFFWTFKENLLTNFVFS